MWPTFYIPTVVTPPPAPPPNTDCWFNIIKTSGTSRNFLSGASLDDDLQFPTVPGNVYRIVGLLKFYREDSGSGETCYYQIKGDGDPEALLAAPRATSNATPNATDYTRQGGVSPQWPWPYAAINYLPYGASNDFGDRYNYVQVHALVKAKTGTGNFGVYWGVTEATTQLKYWTLLAGSWIDIRLFEP